MTIDQIRKILVKITELETDIETLRNARINLGSNEFVSCTLASGGSTKSYTRADASKISSLIVELSKEITSYKRLLTGNKKGLPTETIFLQGL